VRTKGAILSQPHADVTTGKGIPLFWMTAPFAGHRRNEELGRSNAPAGAPLLLTVAPVTSDVLWRAKEGNGQSARANKARAPDMRGSIGLLMLAGRVLRLVQRPVRANHHSTSLGIPNEGDAFETASRSGKPVKAGGTGTGAGANRA
jgi:hypothetical protein